MIKNGGYQIIDLKDNALTNGGEITLKGLHAQLKGSARKPVMVCGIKYSSTLYNDIIGAVVYPSSTSYVVKFTLGAVAVTLTVANTDVVTIAIA